MTKPLTATGRARRLPAARSRVTAEAIGQLVERLTDRDKLILEAVWEHRVLTTEHLTALFFTHPRLARRRLFTLCQLGALERRQPWRPNGSAYMHWVLGPAGAHALAAEQGKDVKALGYERKATMNALLSPKLTHQVGCNGFFARLAEHARNHGNGATLERWWSERRCASLWGDLARPDAFGRWSEPEADGTPARLDFFLEYDNGTVTLKDVAHKLYGYADLAEASGITTPVLFYLPSHAREAHLRDLITRTSVPVATAVHTTSGDGPAGPIWLPVGLTGPRKRLARLADTWGGYEATEPHTPEADDEGRH